MCDNILELLPYMYAIYTMQEMSADPNYDIAANRTWWESFMSFLAIFKMDNTAKAVTGFAAAIMAIALLAGPIGMAVSTAMMIVSGSVLLSVAFTAGVNTIVAAATGEDVMTAIDGGIADGMLWGGLSSFTGAGAQAVNKWLAIYVEFSRQEALSILTANGVEFEKALVIVDSFKGRIKAKNVKPGKVVYRYLGPNSRPISYYVTTKMYSNPIQKLALAYNGNTASKVVKLVFQKETTVLSGKVAYVFLDGVAYAGGGIQYYVYDLSSLAFFANI